MTFVFKKIMSIIIPLVLVGFIAYTLISDNSSEYEQSAQQLEELKKKSEQILIDTKKIQSLSFDSDLFSDQRFTSLRDIRIPLTEVGTGRSNPFGMIE